MSTFPQLVSVVLCCHNGSATLAEQLSALCQQTYGGDWELVFVDDCSTDVSVSIAESFADRLPLRIVHTERALGIAGACNVGGTSAAGDVLLFCHDDDVADRNWLSACAEAARVAPAFGGHVEEDRLNPPDVRAWRDPVTPGHLPIVFGIMPAPIGCNCGVWTSVFREVGGFNEEFGTGEETDFFWRVQLAGHEVRYVPDAVMHYRHRRSLKASARQSYRYGLSNALLFRRFRHLGLRPTSPARTLGRFGHVIRGVPKAVVWRRNRGAWLRMTSYIAGQAVGSARNRVWRVN